MVGAYANCVDPKIQDWQAMYYGNGISDVYDRLMQLKGRLDPESIFSFDMGRY
jgi:Berberine and berberine like